MTSWGEIPTHCPDFNDIIYCNVDKLKKMELLLQDYGEAQKQYALRIQGIAETHQRLYAQQLANSSNPMNSLGCDVIHKTMTNIFQSMYNESKRRSAFGTEVTNDINVSLREQIPKFTSKREKIYTVYTTEMDELKRKRKIVRGAENQYKQAVKNERKAQTSYDNRMTKKQTFKNSFLGLNSVETYQKDKMEKVAIANCSKEDYQKNVHLFNDKQRHIYGDVLPGLCNQQQELFQEQGLFCLMTKDKLTELGKKYMTQREESISTLVRGLSLKGNTKEQHAVQSSDDYYNFFNHSGRQKAIPDDIVLIDYSDGDSVGDSVTISDEKSTTDEAVVQRDKDIQENSQENIQENIKFDEIHTAIHDSYLDPRAETRFLVLYDFSGLDEAGVAYEQVLQCTAGQILTSPTDEDIDDFDEPENGWTKVQNPETGESGFVPSSYVESIT